MAAPEPRLRELFSKAAECQTAEEQAAFLDQACRGDAELRAQLEELLRAQREAGSFLQEPSALPDATVDEVRASERPGTVIGPYKLLQQLGEGGMGSVFMAEQTQPVQRKVALKLIKTGMDSRQIIARFEAERQALALMDHPNIARVLDAGTTDTGRPYFVMELVKGVPITRYCDEHHLTPIQRLELFVPVCQAVQHAHQKGIIHRDLKPSNVMVCLYDGQPVPKVIDFGVAKAAGPKLTEKTLFTEVGSVVGTLEYMSPEQAELNQLDIDTRSDIYSLGVLLYELLTGTTPLERKRFKEAAFLEVLRLIREEESPRPSTRLSTTEGLPTIAANRGLEPKKLSGLVRGELDWIVMKALEKDRSRRYETANGFAQDVQRYLADEPVLACPPSAWYRCRKFTRRHKMGLAMTGLALCLLASLVAGIGWAVRDRAARQAKVVNDVDLALERGELFQRDGKQADAQAALDQAELLAAEAPADPARHERLASLKERLAAEARDQVFLRRFEDIWLRVASQVNVEESRFTQEAAYPEIREALGRYGIAIGVLAPADVAACVQGRPEPSRRYLLAALDESLRLVPKEDAQTRNWLLAALSAADNDAWRMGARQAWVAGDWQTLEQRARDADVRKQPPGFLLLVARSLPPQMGPTRLELLRGIQRSYPADLWANHDLAFGLWQSGRPAEAIRYYTAALALRPDNPGIYLNRGCALHGAGEVDAAIVDCHRALALAPRYAEAHDNLGTALKAKGQMDDAIAAYQKAIRLKKDFPNAHFNLGTALKAKGQLDEAIACYREAIRLKKDFPEAHTNLGNALQAKGQVDKAVAAYRQAIRLKKDFPNAHNGLGNALKDKGQLDEAITCYREAIRLKKDYAEAYTNLGVALKAKGQLDEAIAACREAIRLHKDLAEAHTNLGVALKAKGQLDEAIVAYRQAIRLEKDFPDAHNNLGNALQDKGQVDNAIAAFREAIRLKKDFALAHYNLGNALQAKGQLADAIAAYHQAIRLKKDFPEAHTNLGVALKAKGQLDEAIACYREAIRLKKDDAEAYYDLGNALLAKGQLDEAIAAFRDAVRHKPDYAEAHCNLGSVLRRQGRFVEAVKALRRGHELGAQRPDWRYPSAGWVQQAERLVDLDRRLPAVLRGEATPASGALRFEFAQLCSLKQMHAAAARFYEEALAAQPGLAAKQPSRQRYNGACAAALAGCGQGKDAVSLDEVARARWRRRALDWLRAELTAWTAVLDKGPAAARAAVQRTFRYWQSDSDLAGLRDAAALARLPEAERQACRQFWIDVAKALGQPGKDKPPQTNPKPKP
jgi:tetratricopeptide (TPR) repeat protein